MTARSRFLVAAGFIAAWPATAAAQTPLTLDQAVQRALEHAPMIAEANAREAAADATVRARHALVWPTVTGLTSYLRTNHVAEFGFPQPDGSFRVFFPDVPSNYRARAEIGLPVFNGGRVDALVDAARAEVRAVGADRRAVEADVRLEVTQVYWLLGTAREGVRVLELAVERSDTWVRDVGARVDAGVLPPNDLATARAQRARDQVRLIQARQLLSDAQSNLARLVGAAPGETFEPATPVDRMLPGVPDVDPAGAGALVKRALEQRPERSAFDERQAALRSSSEATRATTRPQLNALAAIEPARPNPLFIPRSDEWKMSWNLGVQATWSIWDGGRAQAEAAATEAQAQAVGHRRQQFDEMVALEVRQRMGDVASSRAALAASDEAVAAAVEAHRVLQVRFDAGVATTTDVLDAQLARLDAELERVRLQAALRLAEARLLRAMGQPW